MKDNKDVKKKKSYLKFEPYQINKKKTINVEVRTLDGELLGEIEWCTAWRRYWFVTAYSNLGFDSKCLKELEDYLDKLMEKRKRPKDI